MNPTLERLLTGLPEYLDRERHAEPALYLAYDGTCLVTIVNHRLTTTVAGGTGFSISIDTTGLTLAELISDINTASPGYDAILLADDSGLPASSLVDVTDQVTGNDPRFFRFTSPLWGIIVPVSWALDEMRSNVRDGLLEMSLKTADGKWVDLWGMTYYGKVPRLPSEADRLYADRIIHEAARWRVNAKALEQIILEDMGILPVITNLHDRAWVIGETDFGFLAGVKYSRSTFEVLADGVVSDLSRLIDRNRAAGTMPFYVSRGAPSHVDAAEDERTGWTVRYQAPIGNDLGPTPDNYAVPWVLVSKQMEQVLKDATVLDFILGQASLGIHALGPNAGSSAVIEVNDATWVQYKNGDLQ